MTIAELAEKSAHITHTYQVTPEVYNYFQLCSKDYNPLHTDEEYAKTTHFGKLIAPVSFDVYNQNGELVLTDVTEAIVKCRLQ